MVSSPRGDCSLSSLHLSWSLPLLCKECLFVGGARTRAHPGLLTTCNHVERAVLGHVQPRGKRAVLNLLKMAETKKVNGRILTENKLQNI